ncbi:MAG: hypothetical protein H7255_01995 [Ramlibacter sp.]|nr:hypothetical protein [Ramlibacter sp.]
MDAELKTFANLAARFALAGFSLNRTTAGDGSVPFVVSRWGFLRPMHSLEEAQQFLKQIQGAKA